MAGQGDLSRPAGVWHRRPTAFCFNPLTFQLFNYGEAIRIIRVIRGSKMTIEFSGQFFFRAYSRLPRWRSLRRPKKGYSFGGSLAFTFVSINR
jgi:hypothetical protein